MGISFAQRFCYFGPARSGSHAIEDVLKKSLGVDFMRFRENCDFSIFLSTHASSYFEFDGDHTRAMIIHRMFPETRLFRSAATFRNPFERVESLFCYTAARVGGEVSQAAFETWVDLVFCNPYNAMNRAHALQTPVFMDDLGIPCVDQIFDTKRLDGLIDYLLEKDRQEEQAPVVNRSSHNVEASLLSARVLDRLTTTIAPDLSFWENLKASGGILRYK